MQAKALQIFRGAFFILIFYNTTASGDKFLILTA